MNNILYFIWRDLFPIWKVFSFVLDLIKSVAQKVWKCEIKKLTFAVLASWRQVGLLF